MTTENFCFWLKGFLEIGNPFDLKHKQLQIVKDHLDLVFNKVTPDHVNKTPTQSGTEISTDKNSSKRVKIGMKRADLSKVKCDKTSNIFHGLDNRKIC